MAGTDEPADADEPEQTTPAVREMGFDQPISVSIAEDSGSIPVCIERRPQPDNTETPFFVRWYRWYRQQTKRH